MATILNASTSSGLVQSADTSGQLELQSDGTTKLTVGSTGVSGTIVQGTAVASTSGTSIDFTNIPSWVKRITVMFNGVSTNGTSIAQVQLGSGSFTTSGYVSGGSGLTASALGTTFITSGIQIDNGSGATYTRTGSLILNLLSENAWVGQGSVQLSSSAMAVFSGGVTLSGILDRVRITTVNGTDTFDAGSINIQYEG